MKKMFILAGTAAMLFACNSPATDTKMEAGKDSTGAKSTTVDRQERNRQVVMASFEALKTLDADALLKDVAPDATDYNDGSMPPTKSLDSMRANVKGWLSALEYVKAQNTITTSNDDYVMVYADWEGKYKSDIMGMKTAGKTYKVRDVDIFRLNDDGKIIEHRSVQSQDAYLKSMGLAMPKH